MVFLMDGAGYIKTVPIIIACKNFSLFLYILPWLTGS